MIHVVGGSYLELCREPHYYELFGSGLRASLALASLRARVRFSTFIGSARKPVLEAKSRGIPIEATEVAETVIFSYLHPLSKPAIEPDNYVRACSQKQREIVVRAAKVLRFGMVEGSAKVAARMATYDPQAPSDPRPFGENGSTAERLAVVANKTEAGRLTGEKTPERACKSILREGAEVAVVKCGTDGCVIATSRGIAKVPAYRTARVWPIGSGDVFTALFAHGWMELGLQPVQAAERASRGTSHYVETLVFPSRSEVDKRGLRPLRRLPARRHKQVYLAGPFFNLPQRWLIEEFMQALVGAGVSVFSPLHMVGRGGPEVVYEADMKGLRECGVILACLDGLDSGTIYEVGYAHCLGKKVIAFVTAERKEDLKMIIGGKSEMTSDFATALYLTVWAATCA
ncbi:MAG TPA: PfkB family carbohydrate kinase [Candidatus Binatia bacterium]|jgi:nucleoside 2-deoxyribosyltransferase|nr:PfkB family carbohydrate kinase [Candidatus Binatia bacterium]